jgi:hypothetical protein
MKHLSFASLLLIILIVPVIQGCISQGDYKSLVIKKGIVHFSFEYSRHFSLVKDISETYTHLMFDGPYYKYPRSRTRIDISVYRAGDGILANKETLIQERLRIVSAFPDYTLLARLGVGVAGVEGEQITYFYIDSMPTPGQAGHIPGDVPRPTISRNVYFEHQGLIWEIQMESNESNAEADKADFEHLLQTFEILD